MPAYFRAHLAEFLRCSVSEVIGELAQANAQARFQLTPEAIEAWRSQLPPLMEASRVLIGAVPSAATWALLLEYPIPRVGKRIDCVILAGDIIIVIETKTGTAPTSAARQVDDYALNLACFHEASHGRIIVPVVVSSAPTSADSARTPYQDLIKPCIVVDPICLGATLRDICSHYGAVHAGIDGPAWDEGRFRPVPQIVEAAVSLYADMDVFEIGHACAAREDLDLTTAALVDIVLDAKNRGNKAIAFVTGVPGAGKTLVGLNAVHQPQIKSVGSFLSGNGPLVKIIREALIRDDSYRTKRSRAASELEVNAFIHNVHRFADDFYKADAPAPAQNVIVFDEAQRAWNAEKNFRAYKRDISEPSMLLEIMDRHADWAVIIALVGGGQEINDGEAGLAAWGDSLSRFQHWKVFAPPEVLKETDSLAGFRLFQQRPSSLDIAESSKLHLRVSTRSIRAKHISDWVNAVLRGDATGAASIAKQFDSKPVLTRSLSETRDWLAQHRRGSTRAGLVASASAARLRADGLEISFDFHQRFDWDHWFLDDVDCSSPDCPHRYCNDVRSSSKLEVAATQFEVQGLELDWVGLCWGEDLVFNQNTWTHYRFNNKSWRANPLITNSQCEKYAYCVNAYRVLLTRARQGMIIYVPAPDRADRSRLHEAFDSTADFLAQCGAVNLDCTGDVSRNAPLARGVSLATNH